MCKYLKFALIFPKCFYRVIMIFVVPQHVSHIVYVGLLDSCIKNVLLINILQREENYCRCTSFQNIPCNNWVRPINCLSVLSPSHFFNISALSLLAATVFSFQSTTITCKEQEQKYLVLSNWAPDFQEIFRLLSKMLDTFLRSRFNANKSFV